MSANDLARLYSAHDEVKRWTAERENATARLDLARINEGCAFLLSQYEPVNSLGIDRDVLRVLLSFVRHNDKSRLTNELANLNPGT